MSKISLAATGVWLLAIIVIFVFPHPFPALTGLGVLFFPFTGVMLMVLSLIALFVEKRKLRPALIMSLIAVVSLTVFKEGVSWGAIAHFYLNKSRYEATVAKVLSVSNEAEREKLCGEDCWVEDSEPDRVGFHYAHGFLNWHDIVYDPTGKIREEDRATLRRFTYLVEAEHLTGDWYICHYAD